MDRRTRLTRRSSRPPRRRSRREAAACSRACRRSKPSGSPRAPAAAEGVEARPQHGQSKPHHIGAPNRPSDVPGSSRMPCARHRRSHPPRSQRVPRPPGNVSRRRRRHRRKRRRPAAIGASTASVPRHRGQSGGNQRQRERATSAQRPGPQPDSPDQEGERVEGVHEDEKRDHPASDVTQPEPVTAQRPGRQRHATGARAREQPGCGVAGERYLVAVAVPDAGTAAS